MALSGQMVAAQQQGSILANRKAPWRVRQNAANYGNQLWKAAHANIQAGGPAWNAFVSAFSGNHPNPIAYLDMLEAHGWVLPRPGREEMIAIRRHYPRRHPWILKVRTAARPGGARAVVHRVYPPPPPPGTVHYVSPSGHVHYIDRQTGAVRFVQPPPPPGVAFIGPRPPTAQHAVLVAPRTLPPPPTAPRAACYVPAPPPPAGTVHYVLPTGHVHYVNAVGRVVYVQPPPPVGVKFVGPPPPTPAAAAAVVSAPPPPAAVDVSVNAPASVSPGAVVDQGSAAVQQHGLELANGILLGNRNTFATAQMLSSKAQSGDWVAKQVLDAAKRVLSQDGAPDDMIHAVDWQNNGDPNDLDSPDLDVDVQSGGTNVNASVSGDPAPATQATIRSLIRSADMGDQNSMALLGGMREAAIKGDPRARKNFGFAMRVAKSKKSGASVGFGGCFGRDPMSLKCCDHCTPIGGERSGRGGIGFGRDPMSLKCCDHCTPIGGEVGFGRDPMSLKCCDHCSPIGAELASNGVRGDGAEKDRMVGDVGFGGRFGGDCSLGGCAPLSVGCPCTGPGFGAEFGKAARHANKVARRRVHKRAQHAHKVRLHKIAHKRHPAFQDGSGGGSSDGSDDGSGGGSGGGGRETPLKQLWLAARDGNPKAIARIQKIDAAAKAGDVRAQSLASALKAFGSIASGGGKAGKAAKLSHGPALTTGRVHGIAAEFGADSIHVLRGVQAPYAIVPQGTPAPVRQAIQAGQVLGQAQELQAVRFPGAPLPGRGAWETGGR